MANLYEVPSILLALLDYIPSDSLLSDSDKELKVNLVTKGF
jgi:hypothetical protein